MKKVVLVVFATGLFLACGKDSLTEQEELAQQESKVEKPTNQIESVDGEKIKRPGSGGGDD